MYPKKNKYMNKKITVNGITYDSKKEMVVLQDLKSKQEKGEIQDLKIKPRYELISSFKDCLGKHERGAFFTPEAYYTKDKVEYVVEVKSKMTAKLPDYILRRKMFKQKYPYIIFIEEIL